MAAMLEHLFRRELRVEAGREVAPTGAVR